MGPAGAGKTTVGQLLAHDLKWPFLDADSLHSPENVARMHRGESLTDADREPWLQAVHDTIQQMLVVGGLTTRGGGLLGAEAALP